MKECPLCCFLDHHGLNSESKEQRQRHYQQKEEQHGSKSASRFKETKQDDASSYGSNPAEEVLRPTTRTKDRYQRGAKERVFRPPPPRLEAVASPPPPPPPPPPPKTIMYPPPPRPTHRKVFNETDRHSRHLPSSSVEEKTPVMQETSASNLSSEASAYLSHSRSSLSSEATWFGASDVMILPDAKTEQVLHEDEKDEEQQKATRHGRKSCAVALEKKLKDRKEKLHRLRMATHLGQTPTDLDKRSSSPQSIETDHSNETECRNNATGMNHSVAWYADDSSSKLEEANEKMQNDLPMEAMEAVFETLLDFGSSTSDDQNAVERAIDCKPGPEAEECHSRTEKKKKNKKDDNNKKSKKKGVKEMISEEMAKSDCKTREKRSRRKKEKLSSRETNEDTQEGDVWCAPKLTKESNPDSTDNYISDHEFETSNELNERVGYHRLATGQSLSVSDLDSCSEDSSRELQPIWSNKFNGREKKWKPSGRKQSRRHTYYEVEAAAALERGSNREEEKIHCSSSLPVESDGETYAAPESEEDSTSNETSESLESHDTLLSDGLKDYEEVFAEAGSSNYVEHDEENAYDEYSYSDEEDHSVPSVIAESDDESYQDSSSRSDGSNISGSSSISDFTDASSMFRRIDHHGRCVYHPYIQLSKKTRVMGKSGLRTAWKVISVNCSECCFEEIVRLRKQNRDTRGVVGKEGKNHRPRLGSQETVATKSMTSSEPSDSSHDGDDSSFRSDPAGEKYDPCGRTSRPCNFPPPRYPRARDKDDSYILNRYDSTSTSTSKSSSYTGSSGETMSTLSLSFPDTFGEEPGSPSRPKGILRVPSSGQSACSAKSQKSTVTFAGRDHIVSFCSAIWTIHQDEVNMNIS